MTARLSVRGLTASHGAVDALRDVTIEVPEGAVTAVLGPNGAGKSTLVAAIAGLIPLRAGSVWLEGRRIDGLAPHDIARAGVVLVPERRKVFPSLTVEEHLEIGRRLASRPAPLDVVELFPRLAERRDQPAGTLSGGEQQQLALARVLCSDPRVLMIDEPSVGLAPALLRQVLAVLAELRHAGLTMVVAEQQPGLVLDVVDLCYVLRRGRLASVCEPAELEGAGGTALLAPF